ncbi:hypothetical protein BCV72DRAFT_190760, partial [Rhizopus microsporus var. microsporus]
LCNNYQLYFTKYVKDATKTENEITAMQMKQGKDNLMMTITDYKPKKVCFL